MSDVNIAPAAPASAPAAPAGNEAVINPNPTTAPQPLGPQTPSRPPDDRPSSEHQRASRRETIERAFEKAEAAGRPGPAQARMGHNQPPEETAPERKAPPRELHREQGRFARAPEQPAGASARQGQPGQARPGQAQPGAPQAQRAPLPEGTPYRAPPPRFSPRAQADWAATPEAVRGDIYRMHHEVDGMHRAYRGDHEVMNTIRPFHAMAQQHGTTLQRALHNYTSMEQKLRSDPLGGLDLIVNNLNLRDQNGRKLGFRDLAYYALSQSPEAHKMVQAQNQQSAHNYQIGHLHQMVNTLARGMQQMQTERQFTYTRSAVDQFADQHPRFDELGDLIEQELRFGFSLDQAYQRAERLRPSPTTRAAQTRTTPAQTRTDRSISGAPDGPSNGTGRQRGAKPVGGRQAIQNAINRVNGGI